METLLKFLQENKEWAFSGLGATFLGYFGKRIFDRKKEFNSDDNSNNINNNVSILLSDNNWDFRENNTRGNDEKRSHVNILFIDDNHSDFSMVSILKKSGFPSTKSVKDITDLNDIKIRDADIIFVDINGVGLKLFSDQGLGLASALKQKYSEKGIVLYSAESNGDRFHKALREVDGCLYKDAEPYQFITKIEELSNGK